MTKSRGIGGKKLVAPAEDYPGDWTLSAPPASINQRFGADSSARLAAG